VGAGEQGQTPRALWKKGITVLSKPAPSTIKVLLLVLKFFILISFPDPGGNLPAGCLFSDGTIPGQH